MPEKNKIGLSFNFLVLSLALWFFGILFVVFSSLFTIVVKALHLTALVNSFNELVSIIVLSIIVFGVFTGCIILAENLIGKVWSKLSSGKTKTDLILTSAIFIVSMLGIYFGLAWIILVLQNQLQ